MSTKSGTPKGDNGTPKSNGRNGKGQFAKGNAGGPGRPKSSWRLLVSEEVEKQSTPENIAKAVTAYFAAIEDGERWAIQDFLDRALGKADQKLDVNMAFTLMDAVARIRESRLESVRS